MELKQQQHSKRSRFGNGEKEEENNMASRIFRVSRASGGKDRHSKVFTSKGLRDRRVRLSVSTAIQFYDLQDRLGFDQPSKAIEWLIKAASCAISKLPSLVSNSFPELAQAEPGCSSTSETSKGSVLSLSRSEIRIKARERARLRAAKDKELEKRGDGFTEQQQEQQQRQHAHDVNQSSFTELLSGGSVIPVTADYFSRTQQMPSSFCSGKGQIFSSSSAVGMMMPYYNMAAAGGDNQFSFVNENMDYNLNFSIAPALAGFHRGTLQSNPTAQLPFSPSSSSSSMDVHNLPFNFGAQAAAATPSAEAHLNIPSLFDSRIQLSREPTTPFCLDGYRPSDLKGKRKS